MPAVLALPAFWGAVAAGATGTGLIVSGKMQANAARDAANAQVTGATKAAELASKSNAETLAFEKEQATADQDRFEASQQANYGQWAARESRMSNFGQALGLPARQIPNYVSSRPGVGGAASQGVGGDPLATSNPKLAAAITDFKSKNPATVGIQALTDYLKQQGFPVARYDYGQGGGLSNNELNLPGIGKYKVGVDDGRGGLSSWYAAGTDDSAPGAPPAGARYPSSFATALPTFGNAPGRAYTPALAVPRYYGG